MGTDNPLWYGELSAGRLAFAFVAQQFLMFALGAFLPSPLNHIMELLVPTASHGLAESVVLPLLMGCGLGASLGRSVPIVRRTGCWVFVLPCLLFIWALSHDFGDREFFYATGSNEGLAAALVTSPAFFCCGYSLAIVVVSRLKTVRRH